MLFIVRLKYVKVRKTESYDNNLSDECIFIDSYNISVIRLMKKYFYVINFGIYLITFEVTVKL